MEKENFINRILNSSNSIIKVEPSEAVYEKIKLRIAPEQKDTNYLKWAVAASITLLIYVNVSLYTSSNYASENQSEISKLINTTNNQLY